jgi:hypothetical protein
MLLIGGLAAVVLGVACLALGVAWLTLETRAVHQAMVERIEQQEREEEG